MWRRTYLLLLLVRLWFALTPSYLHPDENFQGPEVIAGETGPRFRSPRPFFPSRELCCALFRELRFWSTLWL